jgi:hypothetical protein
MVTLTNEMVDSQDMEVLDPEYTRLVSRVGEVPRVYYTIELARSARTPLLSGLEDSRTDFGKIPAFGMWAGRGKSADELLEDVSGRWGGEA